MDFPAPSSVSAIFLSHITRDVHLASAIKVQLEKALPGATVFISEVDVSLGDPWLKAIDNAITKAKAVLALCSPQSVNQPWVNFESGGGWARGLKVIPLCHGGLKKSNLPYPFSIFQGINLHDTASCESLVATVGNILDLKVAGGFDFNQMAKALKVDPPERSSTIGIVLTHGQDEWDLTRNSVFYLPDALPKSLGENWSFLALKDVNQLLSPDLHRLSGIILGSPWCNRMESVVVSAIENWVNAGGRLLLLGFELGDRHHEGNLGDLTRVFGIHPAADIVGPADYGPTKPYGVQVEFEVATADRHPFTHQLSRVRLVNVQTVGVEPGGVEWLRVGRNVVYRPTNVMYRKGKLTQPQTRPFDVNRDAGWLPVAVQAPPSLCGSGAVHAIGTWDLLAALNANAHQETLTFFRRLLDWLSGK